MMKKIDKEKQLREHQKVMLEMLKIIDSICKKNKISYMLFAGTALGAVRHEGFIPWDDDLDIIMLRQDYEKFMHVAPKELDADRYFLQKEFSEHWPMFFSKLRKNNTACIERYIPRDEKVHQGVYIDIFPCDNLSNNKIKRNLQFLASKMIIAKSIKKRGYLTDSKLKKIVLLVSDIFPKRWLLEFVRNEKELDSDYVHTFFAAASKYEKNIFPREWFKNRTEKLFEGEYYPISKNYKEMLTKIYGDYMILPSETERKCKVHAEILDLEHSYEKYIEIQKKMKITEYSRSIR